MQGPSWGVGSKVPHEDLSSPTLKSITTCLPHSHFKEDQRRRISGNQKGGIQTSEPHTTVLRKGMRAGRVLRALLSGEPQNSKLPSQPNSSGRQKGILGQLFSAAEGKPSGSSDLSGEWLLWKLSWGNPRPGYKRLLTSTCVEYPGPGSAERVPWTHSPLP